MRGFTQISKAVLLAAACALSAPLAAQQRKPVVAVLEPAGTATAGNKLSVTGALEDFLRESKRYTVVDRKHTSQILGELQHQRTATIDPKTAKAMGKQLGANVLCVSEMQKDEGYTVINISLINVETGVVERSGSDTVIGNNPKVVRDTTVNIAAKMMGMKTYEQVAIQKALRRSVTFGLYASAGIPMGEFAGVDYPATPQFTVPQTEGYNPGFGARFTMTFPLLFRYVGLRAAGGFMLNSGYNTAAGYADVDLTYLAIGASAELQIFFDESYRHRGTYLFGGGTINGEMFQRDDGFTDTYRKTRAGWTAGLGHTFPAKKGRGGWTLELAYHATLQSNDETGAADTDVAANYLRLSAGYVF